MTTDPVDPAAEAEIIHLSAQLAHANQVIAWLLTSHRTESGQPPTVAIPYRVLDDMRDRTVLVRRRTNGNDVVHYTLLEKAEVVPL